MLRRFLFLLVVLVAASVQATDVQRFELLKGHHFYQFEEGIAHIQTNNAYRFTAQVYATDPGDILGADVITPKAGRRDLVGSATVDPFSAKDKYDDSFHLENPYPNGAYTFEIRTLHDGNRSLPFSITGDVYPNAPILKNFVALQNIPYNGYTEISWQPMAGGTADDFIQFKITDLNDNNIFETPDYTERGALNGLSTRTILEPGLLKANATYIGTLLFSKNLYTGSSAYPGVPGRVGYFCRTEFYMRAVATGLSPSIDRAEVWKTQRFEQLEEGAPLLQARPYQFNAHIEAVNTNILTAATLTLPAGTVLGLEPNSDLTEFDWTDDSHFDLVDFKTAYPDGSYNFAVGHRNGAADRFAATFAPANFPPAPVLQSPADLAQHNPELDLDVHWNPWAGAGDSDFIRVELLLNDTDEKVWDTAGFTKEKHLQASATGVAIPASAFVPGRNYKVQVTFFHTTIFDNKSLGGGLLFGGIASRTKFAFATAPADALAFGISATQFVWQRGDNAFEPNNATPFLFESTALASAVGNLRSVETAIPGKGIVTLNRDETGLVFRYAATNNSAAALAANFPTGSYAIRFDALHDGVRTALVAMASTDLPPVPRVRDFASLPIVHANQDDEIDWYPWVGFQTNTDTISITLFDFLGNAVDLSGQSVTQGAITNVAIFRDTLKANQSYLAKLRFERKFPVDSSGYPGPRGSSVRATETWFYVSTLDEKKLISASSIVLNTSGQLQFRITPAFTGRLYRLDRTSDFVNWTPLQTNLVTGTALQFIQAPTLPNAFYRAVLLP